MARGWQAGLGDPATVSDDVNEDNMTTGEADPDVRGYV